MTTTGQIESIEVSTNQYVEKHWWFIILGLALLGLGGYATYTTRNAAFFIIAIGLFSFARLLVKRKITHTFMQQFAASLGYVYVKNTGLETVNASLFNLGHSQQLEDVVSGTFNNHAVRLFLYYFVVGSGKEQHRYNYTVFEFEVGQDLSHIIVHHQSTFGFMGAQELFWGTDMEHLSLESGDFNKSFKVYVPKGKEIEALEIFTPDLMVELVDQAKNLNFEFSGSRLYIYTDQIISTKNELDAMFRFSEYLASKLAPTLERL